MRLVKHARDLDSEALDSARCWYRRFTHARLDACCLFLKCEAQTSARGCCRSRNRFANQSNIQFIMHPKLVTKRSLRDDDEWATGVHVVKSHDWNRQQKLLP